MVNRSYLSARYGEKAAATVFSHARDVEAVHAKLYKKALSHLIAEHSTEYYNCTICGYIVERKAPETCPICNAIKSILKGRLTREAFFMERQGPASGISHRLHSNKKTQREEI